MHLIQPAPTLHAVKTNSVSSLLALARIAVVLLCGAVNAQAGHPAAAPAAVGEVTLVVGRALAVGGDGLAVPVQRGSKIHPGDSIETAQGGHVHIRFVDGALVSVRPTSRLVVEDYQYHPAQVSQSLVRFRLDHGVARAISGAAAEGARDRFRLNTPLVAIGVRGTDFVVRTQADQTVASVNQGAIIMEPLGISCQPQSTGPCGSTLARLLTAEMGNMLVEFRYNLAQPEIKPFHYMKQADGEVLVAEAQKPGNTALRDVAKSGAGDDVVIAAVQNAFLSIEGTHKGVQPGAINPPGVTEPPGPVLPVNPVPPAQLAWGRWGSPLETGDLAVARIQAAQGRVATVGNNDYVLYRTETGSDVLAGTLSNASFALQQAQAHFTSGSTHQVLPATVQGGTLTLDFAARHFSTQLNVMSAATGSVGLQASGRLREDGIFNSWSTSQSVAGAVALDGQSAAYLFEKSAAGGTLSGITHWSR